MNYWARSKMNNIDIRLLNMIHFVHIHISLGPIKLIIRFLGNFFRIACERANFILGNIFSRDHEGELYFYFLFRSQEHEGEDFLFYCGLKGMRAKKNYEVLINT